MDAKTDNCVVVDLTPAGLSPSMAEEAESAVGSAAVTHAVTDISLLVSKLAAATPGDADARRILSLIEVTAQHAGLVLEECGLGGARTMKRKHALAGVLAESGSFGGFGGTQPPYSMETFGGQLIQQLVGFLTDKKKTESAREAQSLLIFAKRHKDKELEKMAREQLAESMSARPADESGNGDAPEGGPNA